VAILETIQPTTDLLFRILKKVPIEYSIVSLRARVNLVPLFKPIFIILVMEMSVLEQERHYDPIQVFSYALKAAESRRQYPRRFKPFLDFLKLEDSLEVVEG
jgi:hypothetical protein